MYPETIAIDFDGVIHQYSKGWQDGEIYDPPLKGAIAALKQLNKDFNLVIFTARVDIDEVYDWIVEHVGFSIPVTNVKPIAMVYVDDRGLRFHNWDSALAMIKIIHLRQISNFQ